MGMEDTITTGSIITKFVILAIAFNKDSKSAIILKNCTCCGNMTFYLRFCLVIHLTMQVMKNNPQHVT